MRFGFVVVLTWFLVAFEFRLPGCYFLCGCLRCVALWVIWVLFWCRFWCELWLSVCGETCFGMMGCVFGCDLCW